MKKYIKGMQYLFWKNKKKIANWTVFWGLIIFLGIVACYTYIGFIVPISKTTTKATVYNESDAYDDSIDLMGNTVQQNIVVDYNGISAICLYLKQDTSVKAEKYQVHISLVDLENGEYVQAWDVDASKVEDKQKLKLQLDEALEGYDKHYYAIEITSDSPKTGVYKTEEDSYSGGNYYVNGQETKGDILFRVVPVKHKNRFIKKIFLLLMVGLIIGFVLIYYLTMKNKAAPIEKIFLVFMLFMGPIYVCILPAYSAPDEPAHFATSYRLSNQILGVEDTDETYVTCRDSDSNNNMTTEPELNTYRYMYHSTFRSNQNVDNNSQYVMAKVLTGCPVISHLPQAIGITIARLLHLSYSALLILGRIFCLLFYVVIVYFAIKIIPIGKNILFAISVLPMMMEQITSYGYDVVINGLAYLYIAYLLMLIYDKQAVRIRDIMVCVIITVLLAPCKMVYFGIAFLYLLVPNKKFANKKLSIVSKIIIPILSFVSAIAYNIVTVASSTSGDKLVEWANEEGYTLSYVLTHIPRIIGVVIGTFHDLFEHYLDTLIGKKLGWLDIIIPDQIVIAFVIVIVLALFEKKRCYIKTSHKMLYMIIFIATCGMIWLSLLLGWTPLSSSIILGIQGRYFLPVLPLFMLCFLSCRERGYNYQKQICVAGYVLNFLTVVKVFEIVITR